MVKKGFKFGCESHRSSDMLQDLFDELGTIEKADASTVQVFYKRWKPAPPEIQSVFGNGTKTVTLRFVWPGEYISIDTHCYVTAQGNLAASELLDPKRMRYADEALFISIAHESAEV